MNCIRHANQNHIKIKLEFPITGELNSLSILRFVIEDRQFHSCDDWT